MLKDTELPNTAQKVAEPKTCHYEYDRQGNTLSDGENTYRYDSLNRIVEVKTKNGDIQKNRYDGEGLRAELEENGRLVVFIFDGDKVVSEKTDNNTIRYIRGYELIRSDSEKAKTYYHYASDELGSTTHLTDENGNVYNYYEYDAFGNFLTKAENVPNRFCFTGEQYDPLTSQYYLRARFYNPAIGRFLNEDTYYGDGLNLYAYCHNNPVKYVDPSGHDACPLTEQKYNRKEALNQIKRDLGLNDNVSPVSQKMEILRMPNGDPVVYGGKIIYSREMTYDVRGLGLTDKKHNNPIDYVVIQDYSYGHRYPNGIGDQPSHFNVRPSFNLKNGGVYGTKEHYYFKPKYEWK